MWLRHAFRGLATVQLKLPNDKRSIHTRFAWCGSAMKQVTLHYNHMLNCTAVPEWHTAGLIHLRHFACHTNIFTLALYRFARKCGWWDTSSNFDFVSLGRAAFLNRAETMMLRLHIQQVHPSQSACATCSGLRACRT